MTEGIQPHENTPEICYEISWKSKVPLATTEDFPVHTLIRRDPGSAMELANKQKAAGFETKLHRVERTELEF